MKVKGYLLGFGAVLCLLFLGSGSILNGQELFSADLLKSFTYRNLGPFRVSTWIVDIAVPDFPLKAHFNTFYIASRNGGLWKTVNNGTSFDPIFEGHFIGDIALAPSNPNIVWVGTGGASNRKSDRAGDGVYKSTDGGKTWKNMGLKETQHIGRIVVHPKNSNVVYVAAIGHLWTYNQERGVFKTEDGGLTWKKALYVNEKVGAIDIVINPSDPDIVYAASYERLRHPWDITNGGPGSGIYKTTDGGKTWTRLGNGLPSGKLGRIGIDIYPRNPKILYAVIENANKRRPTEEEARQDAREGREPVEREIGGEVYRTEDAGKTWAKMSSEKDNLSNKLSHSFTQIRVDPWNDKLVYVLGIALYRSKDGGKTWRDEKGNMIDVLKDDYGNAFGDNMSFWIDPQDPDRMMVGNHGGFSISYDKGKKWDHYDNLPIAQTYIIDVDMDDPYNIYAPFECHEAWKIPSNGFSGKVTEGDYCIIGTSDGMYARVDYEDSRWAYTTSEYGQHLRIDQKLGVRTSIAPTRRKGEPPYRFTYVAPIQISPHNSEVIYTGGEVLLRSMRRGDDWQEISPDLTTNDPIKKLGDQLKIGQGPPRAGRLQFCAITTISESPVKPGIIWVGTDDGKVWVTKNYGGTWTDLTKKISELGVPEDFWVERVFASHFNEGTAYVCKNGYRHDVFRPFVFKTTDFGTTWTSLSSGLPDQPINVIYEDRKNPNLLFLGNDIGIYVSLDSGKKWLKMNNNIPDVPVHDILVHPRENDLVVATYGRGIFITDITPLRELDEKVLAQDIFFFSIKPKAQRIIRSWGNSQWYGHRHISPDNEPNGIMINYYLKNKTDGKVKITMTDPFGKELNSLEGKTDAGINSVLWNMQRQRTKEEEEAAKMRIGGRDPLALMVSPGEYLVTLEVGDKKFTQKAQITKRAGWPLLYFFEE